jgi:anti-sigma regulatory factor (Ser/Thr protein kinase)
VVAIVAALAAAYAAPGRRSRGTIRRSPMPDDAALLALLLPSRAEAPSAARKALASLNGDLHLISESRLRDAQLLVTELVANAVRHADGDTVAMAVSATPATFRVEVTNSGSVFEVSELSEPSAERAGGWGLRIVDVLAHRWGVAPDADAEAGRVRVWFEIDRPQASAPLTPTGDAPPPA